MGDPAGVGPEILLKSFSQPNLLKSSNFVVFGDFSYLFRVFRYLSNKGLRLRFPFYKAVSIDIIGNRFEKRTGFNIPLVDAQLLSETPVFFGRVEKSTGYASGVFMAGAIEAALKKKINAIVTLPINKKTFYLGGWGKKFVDHTQMLRSLTNSPSVALMLVAGKMRAVHVTQHVPLKTVSRLLTVEKIHQTIELTYKGLREMGIKKPRIAVCGLNPHAGDEGVMGQEERKVIHPAIIKSRRKGRFVVGPLSADALWPLVKRGQYDAGVAMYHDQGQIAIKLSDEEAVNITLGLPFIRTSVGHGTAYDVAGKGIASIKSFVAAIKTAEMIWHGAGDSKTRS